MRVTADDFLQLAKVISDPLLLVSPEGVVLAANPAAARLDPLLAAGRRLHNAVAAPAALDEQLDLWLRVGGPVPARLKLASDAGQQGWRAKVARIEVDGRPALLVCVRTHEEQDRFAQMTQKLEESKRENQYRREAERHQQAALAAERAARNHSVRMQALTAALAGAATVKETARAIIDHAAAVAGAARAVILVADGPQGHRLLPPDETAVGLRTREGTVADVAQPLTAALDSPDPQFFATPGEVNAAYPMLGEPGPDACGWLAAVLPLRSHPDAETIGALGFVAAPGQPLTPAQQTAASIVGAQAAQALERARLYDSERRFAETLQRALLPSSLERIADVECAVRYMPATAVRAVGGDWYATIPLDSGRVGLAIGDVAGHGPEAATVMATMRNSLRALATTSDDPAEVLSALNRFTCAHLPDEMATCAYVVVDVNEATISYANAGHLPPLLLRAGQGPTLLQETLQPPLGVDPAADFRRADVALRANARLVLYTDGLIERREEDLELGFRRLLRASAFHHDDAESACDHLIDKLVGADDLDDDAALLVAHVTLARGRSRPSRAEGSGERQPAPEPTSPSAPRRRRSIPPHPPTTTLDSHRRGPVAASR